MFVGVYVLMLIWIVVAIYFLLRGFLSAQARKEVDGVPKIPMTMCEANKHGLYPSSASLHMNVEALGRPDLDVSICPFCFKERMEDADKLLKAGKNAHTSVDAKTGN